MKKSAPKRWMVLAALLTLAFVLSWPSVHQGTASPYNPAAQAETLGHHPHSQQADQHRYFKDKMDVDCDSMASICCVMAHCCPGISVGPQDLPGFVGGGATTTASAVRGTGNDLEVVLPPPRRFPV